MVCRNGAEPFRNQIWAATAAFVTSRLESEMRDEQDEAKDEDCFIADGVLFCRRPAPGFKKPDAPQTGSV
ncbi:MAG TPA: hypothetical protein VGK70_02210, partial [Thermoanaerobaculia bacterium]